MTFSSIKLAVKQLANVAGLPGIVKQSIGLPDIHSGYGFAIGNVAAFDMDDETAVVSPGGVGFEFCLLLFFFNDRHRIVYILYSIYI